METLRSTNLSEEDRLSVSKILETIDSARYGRLSDTDATAMIDRAENLNQSIYSALASHASKLQRNQCSILLMFVVATSPFGTETPTQSASTDEMQFEQILGDMERSQSKEEFAAVAVRLEELEKRGLKSGSLHFHCGNAWYQAGCTAMQLGSIGWRKFICHKIPTCRQFRTSIECSSRKAFE